MKKLKLLILLFTALLVGCSSIPKEAPLLSTELGKRIKRTQEINQVLIKSYFTLKKSLAEEYLYKEYLPYVAKDFFSDSDMEKIWIKIVNNGNKEERMEYILFLAPKLQKIINEKRLELLGPLDDLENLILDNMNQEYNNIYLINDSLTSYLEVSFKSELKKQALLERANISQDKIDDIIIKVDDASSNLVSSSENIPNKIKEFKEKIESIKKGVR